ncbi:MAG: DNA-processing protein DprA, partial [Stomatobaculum sp.]|nr:DNA-processing protein DprA [Stomatobaculum sp.]
MTDRKRIEELKRNLEQESTLLRAHVACLGGMGREKVREMLRTPEDWLEDPEDAFSKARLFLSGLSEQDIRFLTPEHPDWPARFAALNDPPEWLFVRGELPPEEKPSAAVIGSRNASSYGLRMAEYLSEELGRHGVSVISGLAAGIDCAAQTAAVTAGGRSYGVLGCGVNICYPADNYELFRGLSEKGQGGILSEYPPDTPPLKMNFPDRNRLIAALGDVLVVIESRGPRSGTQITVGQALDQGKTVFAVPGRITDPLSRGCNELIRDGASILTSAADLLEYIGLETTRHMPDLRKSTKKLKPEERRILKLLNEKPGFPDAVIRETGLPADRVMMILLDLELNGL